MKSRKGNWSLVQVPLYPTITRDERLYWRAQLEKILKTGIEFEMNLPDRKGTCKGKSMFCSCVHIGTGCWKKCIKESECKKDPHPDYCTTRINGDCPGDKECKDCDKFEFECPSINCIDFVSVCHTCKERKVDCDVCPEKYDPNKDPGKIRESLVGKFQPTGSFSKAGKYGVWNITHDGSLKGDGGIEVITVGRRFHFRTFNKMCGEIINELVSAGAYLNERCGIHYHVLNGYYEKGGSELEIPMPAIILANTIQLVRKYHPALVWLTAAGDSMEHLTRWEKFRLSMISHSPMTRTLNQLKSDMAAESKNCGNSKYHFMNIQRCQFAADGNLATFHVEFRFPDSVNCPLIAASQAAMFNAIIMKAVDFSQYGLLEFASSPEERELIEKSFKAICNGRGDWGGERISKTKDAEKFFGYYRETAEDLLDVLKPVMIDAGPAYDILKDLAETPVVLRKIQGMKDKDVEKEMEKYLRPVDEQLEERIMAAIDLALYTDCKDVDEWIALLVQDMKEEDSSVDGKEAAREMKEFIESSIERHVMVWNTKTGTLVSR